jgi:curved DNA-binding protein CbpA
MANTLYDILEVIPTASPETIQAAYRSLISRYHPDKVAGLGPELQAIANARTREINHAYDILGDAARRASYDEELRETESLSFLAQDSVAVQPPLVPTVAAARPDIRADLRDRFEASGGEVPPVAAARPDIRADLRDRFEAPDGELPSVAAARPDIRAEPRRHSLRATVLAALAGIAALLALPQAANVIFGIAYFFTTGHARYFPGFVNSLDSNINYSEAPYLLVLWAWLFANYLFGLISYRLSVSVGQRVARGFGEPFAGTSDRLLLFLTFVCVVAGSELLSSAHTMPDILADMFVLAGVYWAERGIT